MVCGDVGLVASGVMQGIFYGSWVGCENKKHNYKNVMKRNLMEFLSTCTCPYGVCL